MKKSMIPDSGDLPVTNDAAVVADPPSLVSERPSPIRPVKNPFDPRNLALPQDFDSRAAVKKLLTTVPVRKPTKLQFVRVHPGRDMRLEGAALLELRDERKTYLVTPAACAAAAEFIKRVTIFTAMTREETLFLWPVPLSEGEGVANLWNQTQMEAADAAMENWVRLSSNMELGAYVISMPLAVLPEPKWPDADLTELLQIAFADQLIDTPDHPVLRRLRGEI
jgi:hypothetical protein